MQHLSCDNSIDENIFNDIDIGGPCYLCFLLDTALSCILSPSSELGGVNIGLTYFIYFEFLKKDRVDR